MKKLLFVLLALSVLSCNEETVPKPDKLIAEDKMIDILYDAALMQAIKTYNYKTLDSANVDPKTYIYKKYSIDSLTLSQNHIWYASNLENYEKMEQQVLERLRKERKKLGIKAKPNVAVPTQAGNENPQVVNPPAIK